MREREREKERERERKREKGGGKGALRENIKGLFASESVTPNRIHYSDFLKVARKRFCERRGLINVIFVIPFICRLITDRLLLKFLFFLFLFFSLL